MGRRRRSSRAAADGITVISWRDIPSQVTVTTGGESHKAMLEPRFQHAIDRAAGVAGLTDSDAYVAQWRRATQPLPSGAEPVGDAVAGATSTVDQIQLAYPKDRLEALVASGGIHAEDESHTDS